MIRRRLLAAAIVAASVVLLVPLSAHAGAVTTDGSGDIGWADGGSSAWSSTSPGIGETDLGGLPVYVDETTSAYWGVPLRLHAACGTPVGDETSTWAASSTVTESAAGAHDFGTPGCVSQTGSGWLLRLWVERDSDSHVLLVWKSDLELHPVGAGCPTAVPAGMPCAYAVNFSPAPTHSPVPCPSGTGTVYPCVFAVNEASMAPIDMTPVVSGIDGLRASAVVGIALILFFLVAGLVIAFRRRS